MINQINDEPLAEFPSARTCPFDPPSVYAELASEQPIYKVDLPSGQQAWLITQQEDVRAILDDPRFSADMDSPGYPILRAQTTNSPLRGTFMRADGEAHARIRRMLNKEFTVRKAQEKRPLIEKVVDDLLTKMAKAGPPVNLVESLALAVPSTTICTVLGVPYEDHHFFEERTIKMINTKSSPEEVQGAAREIFQYLSQLVIKRQNKLEDDLISRLVDEQLNSKNLEFSELVMIIMLLLAGGHETTATMIALGTLTLLQNPEQLAELKSNPSLYPKAVEELLRYHTVAQLGIHRVALEDVQIGDLLIRAGEGVIADLATANRDHAIFAHAHDFDIHRNNSRMHLSFSYGPHHCLGQALARIELEVVFSKLFQKFPNLQLVVPFEEIQFRTHTIGLYGVEELPVSW